MVKQGDTGRGHRVVKQGDTGRGHSVVKQGDTEGTPGWDTGCLSLVRERFWNRRGFKKSTKKM